MEQALEIWEEGRGGSDQSSVKSDKWRRGGCGGRCSVFRNLYSVVSVRRSAFRSPCPVICIQQSVVCIQHVVLRGGLGVEQGLRRVGQFLTFYQSTQ